jgi:hypothetical protein
MTKKLSESKIRQISERLRHEGIITDLVIIPTAEADLKNLRSTALNKVPIFSSIKRRDLVEKLSISEAGDVFRLSVIQPRGERWQIR